MTERLAAFLRMENVTTEGLEPWEAERLAAALLPVVDELRREAAAEALEAAADSYWKCVDFARYPETRDWIKARAAGLRAEP